jgi:hypothetical protein
MTGQSSPQTREMKSYKENPPPPADESPNGVVILGMHRSGTSVLAGIMNLTGYSLGSGKLVGARDSNSKGYFESSAVARQNDEWIREQGIHLGFGRGEVDAEKSKLGDIGRDELKIFIQKVSLGY